jgi:O-antigen/teichoic acid export membrane protein
MSGVRSGIRSGSIGFAARAITQLMLFGVTIVATRVLSIEAFGTFALASLFLILSRQLFYVGPYEFLMKSAEREGLASQCLTANLLLAFAILVVLAALVPVGPLLFDSSDVGRLIALFAPTVLLVAITSWYESLLLRRGSVTTYYCCTLASDVLGAAVAVALLSKGVGVDALVAQSYVRLAPLALLYALIVRVPLHLTRSRADIDEVLRWSSGRYAGVFLNFTSNFGADLILGILLSPAATGLYRAANRIVSALTDLFTQPLQKIAQTNLSARSARGEASGDLWVRMMTGVAVIGWSSLAALAMLADQLVPALLGEKWRDAAPIVSLLCLFRSLSFLDAVTTSFLVCHDMQQRMFRVQAATAMAVVLFASAAAFAGPLAVAAGVGLATSSMSLIYGRWVLQHSNTGHDAFARLAATALPPLAGVVTFIVLGRYLESIQALTVQPPWPALLAGGLGFGLGVLVVRTPLAQAISSLGSFPGRSVAD